MNDKFNQLSELQQHAIVALIDAMSVDSSVTPHNSYRTAIDKLTSNDFPLPTLTEYADALTKYADRTRAARELLRRRK